MASYRELTENFLETRSDKDFTTLYRKIKPSLTYYVKNIVKDPEIAEDIAINTLTKMWTKIDQYDPQYQITTWLYRIAFNESLGYIKHRNQSTSIDKLAEYGIEVTSMKNLSSLADVIEEYEDMKTEFDYLEEARDTENKYLATLKAMDELKDMYREILIDRLLNHMKYEEIAEKYNLPLQTIKNRIRRGKALIIEAYESNE